ncbi:MAG: hypothetical protein ACRCWN_02810 [Fusobacteriaceae bacterium]
MIKLLKLISYMPQDDSLDEFQKLQNKFHSLGLHGMETIVGDYCSPSLFRSLPIKGVHIIYFPTWLDIWRENKKNLLEDFGNISPYGISSSQKLIETFRNEFLKAFSLNPHYVVFHVSHVRPRDIFTLDYEYTDQDILEATLELLNTIFTPDFLDSFETIPYLLFENLPWPGLRLSGSQEELNFFHGVDYPKKGVMMDFSHLICLEKFSDFSQGADFISQHLEQLGEMKKHILGIHLNCSLSQRYLSEDFFKLLEKWEKGTLQERYFTEISHIKSIDTHAVFQSEKIAEIIKDINPDFLIYELNYKNLKDLLSLVEFQNSFLDTF